MPNRLLEHMPGSVRDELRQAGGEFWIGQGDTVPSDSLDGSFIYVVEDGIASKFLRSDNGLYSEIGMVGPEGMFPIGGLLHVAVAPHVVLAQVGELCGRRIRAREFHAIIGESAQAAELVRKYIYFFHTQVSSNIQTSAQDLLAKRIARWLLMCHDRIASDSIKITHDLLSQMVIAHRPTVTNTLNEMRAQELIDLRRGCIRILDRAGLFRIADGSYGLSEDYWNEHIGAFGKGLDPPRSAAA